MMASSHAVTGAAIAVVVREPALALPLAFASHFVCDALPHIGLDEYGGHNKKPQLFHKILLVDAFLLASFMVYLFISSASLLVFACVFLAGSPDLVWAYRYIFQEKFGAAKEHAKNIFNQFHSKIQWSQTIRGAMFEIPYTAILFLTVVVSNL